jgi:hypothetical protein
MGARTNTICALIAALALPFVGCKHDPPKTNGNQQLAAEVDNSWCEQGTQGAYVQDGVLYILAKATSGKYSAMESSAEKADAFLESIARNAGIYEELLLIKPNDASSVTLDAGEDRASYDACTQYIFDPTVAFVGNATTEQGQEVRGTNYLPILITEVRNNPKLYQPQSIQQTQQTQTLID